MDAGATTAEAGARVSKGGEASPARRAVVGWALVEFALVLFSMNVVSLYFPLWVVDDLGASDGAYGLANSAAMALLLLGAPLLGAVSDQAPRRVPLLVAACAVCAGFTALLGTGGLLVSLACFVVATAAQQTASVCADPSCPPSARRRPAGPWVASASPWGTSGRSPASGWGWSCSAAMPTPSPSSSP